MRPFEKRAILPPLVVLVAILIGMPSALAVPGDITLASTSDSGTKGNSPSVEAATSADGATVAFSSVATNLDPADTDDFEDVYVKDLSNGDITLASTSDAGIKGNFRSFSPSLSADGTKVAFWSNATNLDPADTDIAGDVYLKDLSSGDITLVSTSDTGTDGNNPSVNPALSADGTLVAFWSSSTNLDPADTDVLSDIYVKDLLTGDITLASTSDTGVKANGGTGVEFSLSADATSVAFWSASTNLDPADTDSIRDVYVKNLLTGDITLASTSDTGIKANDDSGVPALSADGTRVAFHSGGTNLDPADTDGVTDIFVKDLVTGDITLASSSDTGIKANDSSGFPALSADGTKVAFHSVGTNLEPADTDGFVDVYVKDLLTGDVTLASSSDTGIKANDGSVFPALSADGTMVAFVSFATNLDPADTDSIQDVYVKELGVAPPEQCTLTGTEGDDSLKGTGEDDVICGLGGDDKITGGLGGDDLLLGGEGSDTLRGGSGADILRGDEGNDILRTRDGVPGNDTADGGDGFDRCMIDRGDVAIACP